MLKSSVPKSSENFTCKCCDYNTTRLSQYTRHVLSAKHKKLEISTDFNNLSTDFNKKSSKFECQCGKVYKERTGLWRHKKVCDFEEEEEEPKKEEISDKELIVMLLKQNSQLIEHNCELTKNGVNNTNSHNNTNNSHNKAFNLNFFLNETCKDAMNIMDFVDSIKLQLSDLEKVGELGYVDGISNIITNNLKAIDINKRPVHCTDKKRETMYIKDENKWEKEEEDKKKLRKAIKRVAFKNQNLIQDFKKEHPDYNKYHSKVSDQYNKLVVESMGGSGDNDNEKEDKIIKNISNASIINS